MPLRFKLMAAIFAMLMLMATDKGNRPFDDVLDIFAGLAVLLVLALVSVVPNWSRTDRIDRSIDGENWGDRVDVDAAAEALDRRPR